MKLAIGSDERTHLTDVIVTEVKKRGHQVALFGPLADQKELWPQVARQVAEAVTSGQVDEGNGGWPSRGDIIYGRLYISF